MCGIWSIFNESFQSDQDYVNAYNAFMQSKHRGPCNSKYLQLTDNKSILGFHRLSINGLSNISADQPFIHETGTNRTYVMANGEIYNYKILAEQNNITLSSGSDCEVLYYMYKIYGFNSMMEKLDAECAIIIMDIDKQTGEYTIYYARDQCGIRPLFEYFDETNQTLYLSSELKSIPCNVLKLAKQVEPRICHSYISQNNNLIKQESYTYINFKSIPQTIISRDIALETIKDTLIRSVESRMMSDREYGSLLSGGLDSSLISAIASRYCRMRGKKLKTFCVGMDPNSPDIKYARIVAEHIQSDHTEVIIPYEKWLETIDEIIRTTETYDITTVRASTGQYLISKWIKENTDVRVLVCGEGSDEITGGYIYTLNAPDHESFHNEAISLIENLHYFDVLRGDRGVSAHGIEPRVPFLDKNFIKMYLSIDVNLRKPKEGEMEKQLLRDAFKHTNLLPLEVLYRKKEAFSDGVSTQENSWYKIIEKYVEKKCDELNLTSIDVKTNQPISKESLYYRHKFVEYYGDNDNIIPYFWMPKWSGNVSNPSARVLSHYTQ